METVDSLINVINMQQENIGQLQNSVGQLYDTIENLQKSSYAMTSSSGGDTSLWIVLLLVVFAAVSAYLYYRLQKMEAFINNIVKKLNDEKRQEKRQQAEERKYQQRARTQTANTAGIEIVNKQSQQVSSLPTQLASQQRPEILQRQPGIQQQPQKANTEPQKPADLHPQSKVVKYASIQEDAQGGLKIAERVMNDDTSKLFMVEMAEGDATATYTFNPRAEASILSDLQTFKNFTEPFTITGTPRAVVEIEKGQIEKSGKFWIVKSKLKVDFKY